ncbi:MAG: efflux RND transporter periplasmic adaptor subunit [Acidobacteriota bacterium]|nr:efflux RND transporter periplasmic adaptor subunit [Acidobacteriota bacterium]
MSRLHTALYALAWLAVVGLAGCQRPQAGAATGADAQAVPVTLATVVEESIQRYIQVSGTLVAQERAEVAAEIAGRVVATPIERGSRVDAGSELIRISSAEVMAQAAEAEANVAQIDARLGTTGNGEDFDVERVPEVANARAAQQLAQTELARARKLRDSQLLSDADFDQRAAQADAASRQYDTARNTALQQFQSLVAARARASLARKALADAVVRAPFAGMVAERLVSVGDYVTKGTKVASVIRVDPLRVELTVPAQFVAEVAIGRAVTMVVDAYPNEIFTGAVRYVSPALDADSRALVVEAELANADGRLKPGLFATSRIEQATKQNAVLVPASAVRTVAGAARVFVATGEAADRRVEERVVATGQVLGERIEIASGLSAGEQVVVDGLERIVDGVRIAAR